jgi:FkbM family methyltransferase
VRKGKWRLYLTAKKLCRNLPEKVIADVKDGRKLSVVFSDWAGESIFFFGEHETYLCEIFREYIRPGDVCLDVGANIGWYTTLFAGLVGAAGQVHAFEPVPETFAELKKNIELNNSPENVFLNDFGLGDEKRETEIYMLKDLSCGHASLAARENQVSMAFPVSINTLDWYLREKNIKRVDFIKVDIEGAELMFLKGAGTVFDQTGKPPVLFMEVALDTLINFGLKPNDLIVYLKKKANYKFFSVDELNRKLIEIEGFEENDIGANVLCVPL